jgi:heptosyltransferase II
MAPIGDVVMAMSMITALRNQDPLAEIVWVCGETVASLLCEVPSIQLIRVNEKRLLAGSRVEKIREVLLVWSRVFGRRFDLVLTGYSDPRYRLLTFPVISSTRRSFNRSHGRWFPVPGRYHGDEYVRMVEGVEGPDSRYAHLPELKPKLREPLAALSGGRNLIALAPGGAQNFLENVFLRRWPVNFYGQLARELMQHGFTVALVGSASDAWVRPEFEGTEVLDLIGKTSLPDLVAFYQRCLAVVTHDSGSLHLAMLARTPTVALFGPTAPSEKIPKTEALRVIWGGESLACRPCYDGKTYAACTDNQCMKQISVARVIAALEELIGNFHSNSAFASRFARSSRAIQ